MDLNNLLIWLVGATSALGPIMMWRRHGRVLRGWLGVHLFCLTLLAAGMLFWFDQAGAVATLVWLPLVLLPNIGNRIVGQLVLRQLYERARKASKLTALLHPFDGWPQAHELITAMEHLRRGRREAARACLANLAPLDSPSGRAARLELMRLDHRWQEGADWVAADPGIRLEPSVASFWIRALGELGRVGEMLDAWDQSRKRLASASGERWLSQLRLVVASLAGRVDLVLAMVRDDALPLSPALAAYWHATALQVAGRPDEAARILEELVAEGGPLVREASVRRLGRVLEPIRPGALSEAQHASLTHLVTDETDLRRFGTLASPPAGKPARVTAALIVANVVAYGFEIPGGATDPENLIELGALVAPAEYLEGEWWRVVTSAFLHFGPLHLIMNMGALYYFGRYLERVLGAFRFGLLYAIAAPGAMALIVLGATLADSRPQIIVGASGGVMALLGAILAFLLLRWRRWRTGLAYRDAAVLAVILVLQTLFDYFTPEISLMGHVSGTLLGIALGVLLTPKRAVEP